MKVNMKGASKLAASLSLAGGIVAAALPALAASHPTGPTARWRPALISIGPVGDGHLPGHLADHRGERTSGAWLTAGVVTDTADRTSARRPSPTPSVTLSALAGLSATR